MASTTAQLMAGDGVGLLTRHWTQENARARVLIVHGVGEHSGRYEHVGDFLVERGFDVAAYDHRGHGASGGMRIDIESFDEYLDDLASVVAGLERDIPLVIYGHSMGGLIAAAYAASSRPQPTMYVLSAPALSADIPMHLRLIAKVGNRLRPLMYFPNSIKGEQLSHDPSVGEKYFADPERMGLFRTVWLQDRLPGKSLVHGVLSGPHSLAVTDAALQPGKSMLAKVGDVEIRVSRQTDGGVRAVRLDTGAEMIVRTAYWFAWSTYFPRTAVVD